MVCFDPGRLLSDAARATEERIQNDTNFVSHLLTGSKPVDND